MISFIAQAEFANKKFLNNHVNSKFSAGGFNDFVSAR